MLWSHYLASTSERQISQEIGIDVHAIRYVLPGFFIIFLLKIGYGYEVSNLLGTSEAVAIAVVGFLLGMIMDSLKDVILHISALFFRRYRWSADIAMRFIKIIPLSWGYYNVLPVKFATDYIAVYEVWGNLKEPAFTYLRTRDNTANFFAKMTLVVFLFLVIAVMDKAIEAFGDFQSFQISNSEVTYFAGLAIGIVFLHKMAINRLKTAIGITYVIMRQYTDLYQPEHLSKV
mgnify:CR=1 FL=1